MPAKLPKPISQRDHPQRGAQRGVPQRSALGRVVVGVLVLAGSAAGCAKLRHYKIVPDSVTACRDLQREGVAAFERGEGDRARALLDKAVSASPTDVDARRQLAEVLWQEGGHAAAAEHIDAAVRLEPNHAPTVVRAGEMSAAMGDSERALKLAETAVMLDGSVAGAWALRGRIYRERGQFDRALADMQHALRHAPNSSDLLLDIAEMHFQMGRPQRALTTLHHLLDGYAPGEEPQRALWLEGLAFGAVDRPADAATSLLAASTRGQPHPDLLYQLAAAEAALGRPAAASAAARRALALDQGHHASRELLARLNESGVAPLRR